MAQEDAHALCVADDAHSLAVAGPQQSDEPLEGPQHVAVKRPVHKLDQVRVEVRHHRGDQVEPKV